MVATLAFAAVLGLVTPASLRLSVAANEPTPGAFDKDVARRIEIPDVQRRIAAGEKVVFLDARGSIDGPMIKDAVHVPESRLDTWAKDVARGTLIITYCA